MIVEVESRKKIPVARSGGFSDLHFCGEALKQKHHVICVDNLFTENLANIVKEGAINAI